MINTRFIRHLENSGILKCVASENIAAREAIQGVSKILSGMSLCEISRQVVDLLFDLENVYDTTRH